jgi:hypothetical protein
MPVDMCYTQDPHFTAFNTKAKLTKALWDSKLEGLVKPGPAKLESVGS